MAASGAGIKKGVYDVYTDIVTGDTEAGKTRSEAIKEAAVQKAENGNPALGRTRGVFAQIVNNITSGTFLVTLASAIFNITGSENFVTAVFLAWEHAAQLFPVVSFDEYVPCGIQEDLSGGTDL